MDDKKLQKAALYASATAAVLTSVYMGIQLYEYNKKKKQLKA